MLGFVCSVFCCDFFYCSFCSGFLGTELSLEANFFSSGFLPIAVVWLLFWLHFFVRFLVSEFLRFVCFLERMVFLRAFCAVDL